MKRNVGRGVYCFALHRSAPQSQIAFAEGVRALSGFAAAKPIMPTLKAHPGGSPLQDHLFGPWRRQWGVETAATGLNTFSSSVTELTMMKTLRGDQDTGTVVRWTHQLSRLLEQLNLDISITWGRDWRE